MRGVGFKSEQLARQLSASSIFSEVDLSAIDGELSKSQTIRIEPGQVLLDPKQINTDIFVVLSGELLVCLEPHVLNPLVRLGAGDCAGELSIIDSSLPSAYVVAAIQTELLAIPKPVLWRMLKLQPTMALNLLHVLTKRIRENNVVLLDSLELQREYRSKAETDELTGLHNRAWFEEVFPKQLDLCERTGQHASLLIMDIDHFKKVNDQYGHQSGDEALRLIGILLRRNLRANDLCARYGGEEMIVLMPGTEVPQAKITADRLRKKIATAPLVLQDGRTITIKVSGGLAQWQPGSRLADLIRAADQALYRAKSGGRNQIAVSLLPCELGQ